MTDKYDIIVADPPWQYKEKVFLGNKINSSAEHHYTTMSLSDLKKMNVSKLCNKDCLLFLWATGPLLDEGIELLKAWGFEYKQVAFVWDKQRVNPGYYTMTQCEFLLVGKRGKIPSPRGKRNIKQFVSKKLTKHSAKPEEFQDFIEEMFPEQTKLEMFARRTRTGKIRTRTCRDSG
jgi:N6-adenosine-specific RNA methylase IME4